jgi:hypothetical protein
MSSQNNNMIIGGAVAAVVLVLVAFQLCKQSKGKSVLCAPCKHDLEQAAANGDKGAAVKLGMIEQGVYKDKAVPSFMGPFGYILGLLVLVGVIYGGSMLLSQGASATSAYTAPSLEQLQAMTSRPFGR